MHKLFLVSFLIFFITIAAQSDQKYINVNGTSELTVPADQITFYIKIEVVDETVAKSKDSSDVYCDELLGILHEMKIDTSDINVSPITIGKNYERKNGERVHTGFYTRVNVYFLLRDLSKYYELTNKLASNDNYNIKSSDYSISNYEEKNKQAYIEALKAAREKAEYMAETMEVKITDVLEISDNSISVTYSSLAANTVRMEASGSGDLNGKVIVKRSVTVKFAID